MGLSHFLCVARDRSKGRDCGARGNLLSTSQSLCARIRTRCHGYGSNSSTQACRVQQRWSALTSQNTFGFYVIMIEVFQVDAKARCNKMLRRAKRRSSAIVEGITRTALVTARCCHTIRAACVSYMLYNKRKQAAKEKGAVLLVRALLWAPFKSMLLWLPFI